MCVSYQTLCSYYKPDERGERDGGAERERGEMEREREKRDRKM